MRSNIARRDSVGTTSGRRATSSARVRSMTVFGVAPGAQSGLRCSRGLRRRAIMYEGSPLDGSSSGNVQWQYSAKSTSDGPPVCTRVPFLSTDES